MVDSRDIGQRMAGLGIEDEENESFVLEGDIEENVNRYDLCLIGRLLTEKNINVRAMKSKLADVWKPTMGITIKEIERGIFLFQFFRKDDLQWVMKGGPWTFDNVMMALEMVTAGANPKEVSLYHLHIWIQIHNLPMGFMMETVGRQLGNFFGEFLEYNAKNNTSIWRDCMRIRIKLDVRKPLKRKKKIVKKDGTEFVVSCKYERLGEFCFSCGMVTHTDRFCRSNIDGGGEGETKKWGSWLRAPPRRVAEQVQSKWLREEGDDTWEARIGREGNYQQNSGEDFSKKGKEIRKESNYRELVETKSRSESSKSTLSTPASFKGFNTTSNMLYGLNDDDSIGLQLDERKRRRSELSGVGQLDIVMGQPTDGLHAVHNQEGAVISVGDLTAPKKNDTAELTRQASRLQ